MMRRTAPLVVIPVLLLATLRPAIAQESRKPFTAAVETELWNFIPGFDGSNVHFSPDGDYVVVYCQRGRIDINRAEDSFRFYLAADVESFMRQPASTRPPDPFWLLSLSEVKEGQNVEGWSYRWLSDSSGVAFNQQITESSHRLAIADVKARKLLPLTPANEDVQTFDVLDRNHYVYTSASTEPEQARARADERSIVVVGTGRSIGQLLIPDDAAVRQLESNRSYHLWAVIGEKRFEVERDGAPFDPGDPWLALSPDGRSLVTSLPVPEVPKEWETLYPPPSNPYTRIRAGHDTARQFVRLDLETGAVHPLIDAPRGLEAGWIAYGNPAWSRDGRTVLLPNTFLKAEDGRPSRPCIAVVDVAKSAATRVETLIDKGEPGHHMIWAVDFAPAGDRVVVRSGDLFPTGSTEYRRATDGSWQPDRRVEGNRAVGSHGLEMTVKQGINDPPLLLAFIGESSRVLWDPNPELQGVELGEATLYTWKEREGLEVRGGLYKPVGFEPGKRRPLIIQTHGFGGTDWFLPSGTGFPNEFAARQLAAAGFFVLQADDMAKDCMAGNREAEGPCAASNYEAAARQLVADGLVDPDNVGLIGFSRSCFYVMEALTRTSYPYKAALIGDGVLYDYFQFLLHPDPPGFVAEIGGAPSGDGLHRWLELSPGFNLDRVKTPLTVVGHGPSSLLDMWGVYAGLHALAKPVELVMLRNDEHVITNPAARMASQTLTVDWFRFWLQGFEDPDPARVAQYARWRELRKAQEASGTRAK